MSLDDDVDNMERHAGAVLATLPAEVEMSLGVMGYAMNILIHAIKPEYRFEAAKAWALVFLNNVHRGIEDQRDATKH
jgi:hypothetical protein